MSSTPSILEKELGTFHRELTRLLAEASGKFALVKGDSVLSVWSSYEDALQDGYSRFGLESFLVKRIQPVDRVHRITRNITPICQYSISK